MLKRTTPIVLLVAVCLAIAAHNPAPVTKPYNPDIDPADFGGPIDNPYLPLKPGTVFRYRGVGDDGKTRELNIVRVTRRKKRIMGIDAIVVLDKVWSGGKPEERTFDWYAQDRAGNVWYFGEDSSDWEHGHWVRNDGSWTAGVGNGEAGRDHARAPAPRRRVPAGVLPRPRGGPGEGARRGRQRGRLRSATSHERCSRASTAPSTSSSRRSGTRAGSA